MQNDPTEIQVILERLSRLEVAVETLIAIYLDDKSKRVETLNQAQIYCSRNMQHSDRLRKAQALADDAGDIRKVIEVFLGESSQT